MITHPPDGGMGGVLYILRRKVRKLLNINVLFLHNVKKGCLKTLLLISILIIVNNFEYY